MIHTTGGRYDLKSFQKDRAFLDVINRVQTNELNEVLIEITSEELKQFSV